MKNSIALLFLFVVLFTSCKKDDDTVFDKSPDDRLNEALTSYQTQLVGAENGWKAFIYPKSGSAYFFYFKFDNKNRVKMYSTFDSASAVTVGESSYRLKSLQQPSLIFDTYSYVHVLADPNENVGVISQINGGPVGTGLQSDFEFYFDSTSNDTLKFVGRFNGSHMTMIRATKQEADSYNSGSLGRGLLFENLNKYQNYFKRVTIGSITYEISLNSTSRTVTFSWINSSGNLQTFTTPFFYSSEGVSFINPFNNGSQTINGLTNLTWDAATTTLGFSVNGTPTTVAGAGQPLRTDLTAARRWWQYGADRDIFWYSIDGFHVNGVDNAYRIDTITSGANKSIALIYWPGYNPSYDFFGPLFVTPANSLTLGFGTAPNPPTFTSDGRAIFSQLGNFGSYPTTGGAALSRARLYSAAGYYFVQTGATTFDMVSAADSRIWISWQPYE